MTREYETIAAFYGDRCAARSGVRLMNHIDEGLALLEGMRATERNKAAFCLHPIVQNGEDVDLSWVDRDTLLQAEEYRDRANSYLCRPATDHVRTVTQVHSIVGGMSPGCARMLRADKIQNLKDFYLYHHRTHPRVGRLEDYFKLWLAYLDSGLWEMAL